MEYRMSTRRVLLEFRETLHVIKSRDDGTLASLVSIALLVHVLSRD